MTPQRRRLHLIDKHMYPKNFFFAVTKEGIDGRNSLLLEAGHRRRNPSNKPQAKEPRRRDRRSRAPNVTGSGHTSEGNATRSADSGPPETSPGDGDAESPRNNADQAMEGLTGAMSALKFIPPNVRFGRGGGGTGFSKR